MKKERGKDINPQLCWGLKVRKELETRGHTVFPVNRIAGGMNGVLRDESGMLHGGACWRADGSPMGISGGRTVPGLLEPDPLY